MSQWVGDIVQATTFHTQQWVGDVAAAQGGTSVQLYYKALSM